MQNFSLIWIFWRSRHPVLLPRPRRSQAGFTLVELLVVIIIVGAIAAIAAPGWLGFVQQRRVTAANDTVVRALQQAQSQAKSKKLTYSVSFRVPTGGVPEIAVYQSKIPDKFNKDNPGQQTDINPATLNASAWQSFGNLGIKPQQIWIGTNVSSTNTVDTSKTKLDGSSTISSTPITTVTFDYTGALPSTPTPSLGSSDQGIIIAVGAYQPNSNPPKAIDPTRRCVKVSTLLGSIQLGKIDSTDAVDQCKPI